MIELNRRISEIVKQIDGRVGVCVMDATTNEQIGIRMDEPLPMASVCKIPILVAAYRAAERGDFDLNETVEFTPELRTFGSGLFNYFVPGFHPTYYDLLLMMIVVSDNAATDIVLRKLTPAHVTETMRDLGHEQIRIDRTIGEILSDFFEAVDSRMAGMKYGEWDGLVEQHRDLKLKTRNLELARLALNKMAIEKDNASPRDISRLCLQIARNECASPDSCSAMIQIMDRQQLNNRLPRDLPAFTRFPHKTGTFGNGAVVNDAGILYVNDEPVAAVACLSRDVASPIHVTCGAFAAIGRAVYEHYNQ